MSETSANSRVPERCQEETVAGRSLRELEVKDFSVLCKRAFDVHGGIFEFTLLKRHPYSQSSPKLTGISLRRLPLRTLFRSSSVLFGCAGPWEALAQNTIAH